MKPFIFPLYGIKSYVNKFVVYFQIARLQDRITIVQQHMATEQCSGGPHCMLQDGMFVPPFLDPAAQVLKNFFVFGCCCTRLFFQ
jgi:hypothetical protein